MTTKKLSETNPNSEYKPTKISRVLDLLSNKDGATLDEIVEATGWQKHSARAALTSLKKKGHTIERSKNEGASSYRIGKSS